MLQAEVVSYLSNEREANKLERWSAYFLYSSLRKEVTRFRIKSLGAYVTDNSWPACWRVPAKDAGSIKVQSRFNPV
jgi:hypothetical protein